MSSFKEEVEALMFSFVAVSRHETGNGPLWSVHLLPEMLDGSKEQLLPPGQHVELGSRGFMVHAIEPPHDGDWACRPYFRTHESAARMVLGWMWRKRKDITRACIEEAKAGRAWRARYEPQRFAGSAS